MLGDELVLNQVIDHLDAFQNDKVFWIFQQLLNQRQSKDLDLLYAHACRHSCQCFDDLHADFVIFQVVDATEALLDHKVTLVRAKYL